MIGSFQNQLKTKQINFHPNEFLIDWKKSGEEVVSVQLLSQTLKADIVIFSAQTCPNTSLLKDKVALYEDDTVMVNEYLQTSDSDIYAIGDIVPVSFDKKERHLFLPLVTRAVHMARAVALTLCEQPTTYDLKQKNNSNGHYRPLFRNCWVDRRRSTIFGTKCLFLFRRV